MMSPIDYVDRQGDEIRITLRLPRRLRDDLIKQANGNGRSMNGEIAFILDEVIAKSTIPTKRYPAFLEDISLRDWFAGQSLMGMVGAVDHGVTHYQSDSAALAYRYADAMLVARKAE